MPVTWGRRNWEASANERGFLLEVMKAPWNLLVVIVILLYGCTRNHCIVEIKSLKFMICELYLTKAVIKSRKSDNAKYD